MIGSRQERRTNVSIGAKPLLAVRHRPFALAGLVSLALCAMTSVAQLPSTPTDLQVKAAYLYKFAAFVQWPNGAPRDSFAICVLGRDPFGATLDATLTGGTIEGKPLEPLRISNPQDAARCQIVFISSSEEPRLKALLQIVDRMPVLTV